MSSSRIGDWTARLIAKANPARYSYTRSCVYSKYDAETCYRSTDSNVVRSCRYFLRQRRKFKMASAVENFSDEKRSSRRVRRRLQSKRHIGPLTRTRSTVHLRPAKNRSSEFRPISPFCSAPTWSGRKRAGRGDDDAGSGDWRQSPASSASRVQSRHAARHPGTCRTHRPAGAAATVCGVFHTLCPLNR